MKKAKSLILSSVLVCLLAVAMILTMVPTNIVSSEMNLKIAESEVGPPITISFDANGGSGNMDTVYTNAYTTYTLPECLFTAPENQQFKCWATKEPKGNFNEINQDSISLSSQSITLFAIWEEAQSVATNMTASYSGQIIVGSKIDPSKINIVVSDQNGNDMNIGAGDVTYWYAGNQIADPINYVFNAVGSFDITVEYENVEATMTVNVVEAPVVEEPEPEPTPEQPENPSVDQPVVEQPTTEDNDGKGLNVGAILGIVFGSLAVLGLGGSLLWIFVFRK